MRAEQKKKMIIENPGIPESQIPQDILLARVYYRAIEDTTKERRGIKIKEK